MSKFNKAIEPEGLRVNVVADDVEGHSHFNRVLDPEGVSAANRVVADDVEGHSGGGTHTVRVMEPDGSHRKVVEDDVEGHKSYNR